MSEMDEWHDDDGTGVGWCTVKVNYLMILHEKDVQLAYAYLRAPSYPGKRATGYRYPGATRVGSGKKEVSSDFSGAQKTPFLLSKKEYPGVPGYAYMAPPVTAYITHIT